MLRKQGTYHEARSPQSTGQGLQDREENAVLSPADRQPQRPPGRLCVVRLPNLGLLLVLAMAAIGSCSYELAQLRVSVQKACFVLDAIRGKDVQTALGILEYNPRYASSLIKKLLESAIRPCHGRDRFL